MNDLPLCKCGCGKHVSNPQNTFINGHWIRNKKISLDKHSDHTKRKMSISAITKFEEHPHLRKLCGHKLTYEKLKERYPILFKHEEILKSNKDIKVKCKRCCKFFIPTYSQLYERIRAISKPKYNIRNYFFCSDSCKKSSKFYNRHINIDEIEKLDKYYEYYNLVYRYTGMNERKHYKDIPNIELRGKKYGYDLDHKYSIYDGFKNDVNPKIIGHWKNLEIITMFKNRGKKHKSSSITLEELLRNINNVEERRT